MNRSSVGVEAFVRALAEIPARTNGREAGWRRNRRRKQQFCFAQISPALRPSLRHLIQLGRAQIMSFFGNPGSCRRKRQLQDIFCVAGRICNHWCIFGAAERTFYCYSHRLVMFCTTLILFSSFLHLDVLRLFTGLTVHAIFLTIQGTVGAGESCCLEAFLLSEEVAAVRSDPSCWYLVVVWLLFIEVVVFWSCWRPFRRLLGAVGGDALQSSLCVSSLYL